ncbi:MAG: lipocalin-like domain-containing protein [Chthoniobacterales bacterium]
MKRLGIFLVLLTTTLACGADWQIAEPGWRYEFPRDHHVHENFKTEWWYFTGNLADAAGRRFGYELTFFRQGIRPPGERAPQQSRFVVGDLKFAHFTVTDVAGKRFRFEQKASRGAFGEAGFDGGDRLAWIDDWNLRLTSDGHFQLQAKAPELAIDLQLTAVKPPVIHGQDGISQKAAGAGHASHYYSFTRLTSAGEMRAGGKTFTVQGESWFDHEWATNQLAPDQVGWDWLSIDFADGSELMLYRMRLASGATDPTSSGTWVATDGATTHLPNEVFRMTPTDSWKSEATGANYPVGWKVEIPGLSAQFTVKPALQNQELALLPLAYWEGAVEIDGTRDGKAITGRGYLELTGYAGPLRELQR